MASPFPFGGHWMRRISPRESAVGGLLRDVCALAKKAASTKQESVVEGSVKDQDAAVAKPKGAEPAKPGPPVKDGQHYIKTELLKELSQITTQMISSAKGGGTAPLRLLWELGKLHEDATMPSKRREPSLGKLLMAEIRKKDGTKKQPAKQAGKQK